MTNERDIICNQIQTPDGTILKSLYRHDYNEHVDNISGELYIVDGGNAYLKRSVNEVPYAEMTVYSDDTFEVIRENSHWGTMTKEGVVMDVVSNLSNKHVENIIIYLKDLSVRQSCKQDRIEIFEKELEYRKEHGIYIEDLL